MKCSGERPECGRCTRERIECVYSPQKTMGRPRKRRREGEADVPSEQTDTSQNGHFNGFGLISPPEFADLPSGNEVYAQVQIDPCSAGIYGPAPPLHDLEYVAIVHSCTIYNTHVRSFDQIPPIDPSLWDQTPTDNTQPTQTPTAHQTALGPCTCLSLTYLTLTDLQTVRTFSFPQVVIPLRKAMASLSSLMTCPICPSDPFSAIQNISSIVSLFKAIVERLSKVLHEVDLEAARLTHANEKKPYRIGDNNPALAHLHTGTLDCPMGFNISLEPDVWKHLVKTALRTEVDGGGSNPNPLMQLLKDAEARQQRWHGDEDFLGEERRRLWGEEQCDKDKMSCEALGAEHIRRAIGMLSWE